MKRLILALAAGGALLFGLVQVQAVVAAGPCPDPSGNCPHGNLVPVQNPIGGLVPVQNPDATNVPDSYNP